MKLNKIIPFIFTFTLCYSQDVTRPDIIASVSQNGIWIIIDSSGKTNIPITFLADSRSDAPHFMNNLAVAKSYDTKNFGMIDINGAWIIPPEYFELYPFSEGLSLARKKNTDTFNIFLDRKNHQHIFKGYEEAYSFKEGVSIVVKKAKYGMINKKGLVILPCVYSYIHPFSEGLVAADIGKERDEKGDHIPLFGFVNSAGKFVIKPAYKSAHGFRNGISIVSKDGKKDGAINKKGEVIIPFNFIFPVEDNGFKGGLAFASDYDLYHKGNKRIGIINTMGEWIMPPTFDHLLPFNEDLAPACVQNKWGFIDNKGRWVIKPTFEMAEIFNEGMAAVKKEGKWGFINKQGELVIEALYEEAQNFSYNLALVKIDGLYGYISRDGKWKIKPVFENGNSFHNSLTGK